MVAILFLEAPLTAPVHDFAKIFIEVGAATIGLAVLARVASHFSVSSIPLYLLAGLAFGNGGIVPLNFSADFIGVGAEIGVLLLLFMLGLEYSGEQLKRKLKSGLGGGVIDLALNFPPGFAAGLLMGWKPLPAFLLGGVTYISSSGIIAKVLSDLSRTGCPETSTVLSILVIEDLVMAVYLPLAAVLIVGGGLERIVISVTVAVAAVLVALFAAIRFGNWFSSTIAHRSDEIILLTIFGCVLLVGGLAQKVQVSAAIGAFLVGIAVSGPMAEQSYRLLAPLRDLTAAIFFFFFGLEIDPRSLPPVLVIALALAAVTTLTKVLTGYWSTRRDGLERRWGLRAGFTLVARGEFSIVIAGLGVALEPRLGPLSAAYVLTMAILGPIAARLVG
ncbi:MAG TPA: cation:proton antiporter [Terracidiphilus sp.]|nr:cation:proton antiporter [Terracidiphilus sp.]